jgi:hypothetical protein
MTIPPVRPVASRDGGLVFEGRAMSAHALRLNERTSIQFLNESDPHA